jgi:hypothetical protein
MKPLKKLTSLLCCSAMLLAYIMPAMFAAEAPTPNLAVNSDFSAGAGNRVSRIAAESGAFDAGAVTNGSSDGGSANTVQSESDEIVRVGNNLINNGDFETDDFQTAQTLADSQWTAFGTGTSLSQNGRNSSAAAELALKASAFQFLYYRAANAITEPGEEYEVSYWWKVSDDFAGVVRLSAMYGTDNAADANGRIIDMYDYSPKTSEKGVWVRAAGIFTADSKTAFNFEFVPHSGETGYLCIDDVELYKIARPGQPEAPVIVAQPKELSNVSQSGSIDLAVAANSPDGGEIAYQWYESMDGLPASGAFLNGETNATLTVSPLPGNTVLYYYCAVTNTKGGMARTLASNLATVVVNAGAYAPAKFTEDFENKGHFDANWTVNSPGAGTNSIVSDQSHGGSSSWRATGNHKGSNFEAIRLNKDAFKVIPGRDYRLTAWVKTDFSSSGHWGAGPWLFAVRAGSEVYLTDRYVNQTSDWTEVAIDYTAKPGDSALTVMFSQWADGAVWFDDIALEELRPDMMAVTQKKLGSIFMEGGADIPGVMLRISNLSGGAATIDVSASAKNLDTGAATALGNLASYTLDSGAILPSQAVDLEALAPGRYEVTFTAADGENAQSAAVKITVLSALPARTETYDSKYGWNVHQRYDEEAAPSIPEIVYSAGIGFLRDEMTYVTAGLREQQYQKMKNYKLSLVDLVFDLRGGDNLAGYMNTLKSQVAEAAQRDTHKNSFVEIWNEPNNLPFWPGGANPAAYAAMLKELYAAGKAANPYASFGGASLAGSQYVGDWQTDEFLGHGAIMPGQDFARAILEAGALPYMDILTWHPYELFNEPEAVLEPRMNQVKTIVDAYGGWLDHNFTEHGWPSYRAPEYASTDEAGRDWNHSEEEQAQYLIRALLIADHIDVLTGIELYDLRDDGTSPDDFEHNDGSLYNDFTPKPAYMAISAMTRALMNTEYFGRLSYKENEYAQVYQNYGGDIIVALWNADKTSGSAISLPVGAASGVTVTDMYGNTSDAAVAAGGNVSLAIDGSAQYVTIPAANVTDGSRKLLYSAAKNELAAKYAFIAAKIGCLPDASARSGLLNGLGRIQSELTETLDNAVSAAALQTAIDGLFDLAGAAIDEYSENASIAVYNITEGAYLYAYRLIKALIPAYQSGGATPHDPATAYLAAENAIAAGSSDGEGFVISGKIMRKAREFKNKHDTAAAEGFDGVASAYGLLSGKLATMAQALATKQGATNNAGGGADLGDLQATISTAEGKAETLYTTLSWTALSNALAVAKGRASDPNSAQEAIDAANEDLLGAIAGLKEKAGAASLLALQGAIDGAKALADSGLYTHDSAELLSTVANVAASALAAPDDLTDADLDSWIAQIEAKIGELDLLPAIAEAAGSLGQLLGNVAGFEDNADVFADPSELYAALAAANAILLGGGAPETEIGAAYAAVADAVEALGEKAAYSSFYSLIALLKDIAQANYNKKLHTNDSWAVLESAVGHAWVFIKTPPATPGAIHQINVIGEIASLNEARAGLRLIPAVVPKGKDVFTGVYAAEAELEALVQDSVAFAAEFGFTGRGLQNIGTARFLLTYSNAEIGENAIGEKVYAVAGAPAVANPNPADYAVKIAPVSEIAAGYTTYEVWVEAIGYGNTFSIGDGDTLITVKLNLNKHESQTVSMILGGTHVSYYANSVAVPGEEITAASREDPAYASERFIAWDRYDLNRNGAVDISDIELLRNLFGAYKDAGGKWRLPTTHGEISAAIAERADLSGDGEIDTQDFTALLAAWEHL